MLDGLLGADVIGFQRAADAGNFARAVRRLFGGGTSVRLRFSEHASPDADGVVRMLRSVRADLAPGRYVLTLRVARPDGGLVERVRTFRMVEGR